MGQGGPANLSTGGKNELRKFQACLGLSEALAPGRWGLHTETMTYFPQHLAPGPALTICTWVCHFHVILNMKEVGDVEFVQIGGVL